MKSKFRLAFFSHFLIDRDDDLMMLVFLNYCQYWIYAKICVQHRVFPWDIEILNNIVKVVMKRISYSCVWARNFSILNYDHFFFDDYFIREEWFNWFKKKLLSVISFGSNFETYCFLAFCKRVTHKLRCFL